MDGNGWDECRRAESECERLRKVIEGLKSSREDEKIKAALFNEAGRIQSGLNRHTFSPKMVSEYSRAMVSLLRVMGNAGIRQEFNTWYQMHLYNGAFKPEGGDIYDL